MQPIFVIGAALTDLVGFPSERAPQAGESVPGRVQRYAGGVGRNLAENLTRLSLTTELITAFGGDHYGRQLLQDCQEINIGVRHSILAEERLGAVHLALQNAQNDLQGGIADLSLLELITPDYLHHQLETLGQATALCVDANLPAATLDWIAAQEWEIPLYLDPVSRTLAERVRPHLSAYHTLKLNRAQAESLTGTTIRDRQSLEDAVRPWLRAGVQRVFITLGGQGAFAADHQRSVLLPAAKVSVTDTTGAGDAFQAGVLWATLRKWSLEDCCRAGLAAATLSIRNRGAVSAELSQTSLLECIRKFC